MAIIYRYAVHNSTVYRAYQPMFNAPMIC